MKRPLLLSLMLTLFMGTLSAAEQAPSRIWDASFPCAVGPAVTLGSVRGDKGTVLVFLSTECPISNHYVPTLNRLSREFAAQGIQFVGVNSNLGQSLRDIQHHAQEYKLEFTVLKDVGGELARIFQAATCPEAVLIRPDGQTIYQGRIDDRYVRRGVAGQLSREDLTLAIRSQLAGTAIDNPRTEVVGCPIEFARPVARSSDARTPTYHRDIARVLQNHCQECHRPGGIGPFSLTDFDDALRWSEDLRTFTGKRLMPPWKAIAGFGDFAAPRTLPQHDIDQIAAWVAGGCPEGDRDDAPAPREFREEWKLGREPDVVLTIPEFTLAADGPDEYHCFILPTSQDSDCYVTEVEVLPGNSRVVHHVIAFLDVNGKARQLDERHPGPGYTTNAGFPGFFPTGSLGGWAPGNQPAELPAGMARILPKRADIVLQIHYHRSGKVEQDRTRVGLYFSRVPVDRAVRNLAVMPLAGPLGDLRIPAGDPHFEVKTALVLPQDMYAVAITPHMHLLGRDMQVTARLPDGKVQPLVRVEDWDFNWQETYVYREPVNLPRQTRLELVAHYDNSERNHLNPHKPPQDVFWGEQTTEEMCIAILELVPHDRVSDPSKLRWPTREEQLRMLFTSRLLDTEVSPAEKAWQWLRLVQRMSDLERTNGQFPEKGR